MIDHNNLNIIKAMYESLENENGSLKQLNTKLVLNAIVIKQGNTALKEKSGQLIVISFENNICFIVK